MLSNTLYRPEITANISNIIPYFDKITSNLNSIISYINSIICNITKIRYCVEKVTRDISKIRPYVINTMYGIWKTIRPGIRCFSSVPADRWLLLHSARAIRLD